MKPTNDRLAQCYLESAAWIQCAQTIRTGRHSLTPGTVTRHGNQRLSADFELNPAASTFTDFTGIAVYHRSFLGASRNENALFSGSLELSLSVRNRSAAVEQFIT